MINYSIIIPHRDSLDYLKRAIKSIPERKDLEIIVIDNSLEYQDFDCFRENKMVTILYSDVNKGAGHARNVGIENSVGKWFLFLDADDFFHTSAFDKFDEYVNQSFDIVFFGSSSVYNCDNQEMADRHKNYSQLVQRFCQNKDSLKREEDLRYKYFTPWSKLISAELVKKNAIEFEEIAASNDLMFSMKIGHYAEKIQADEFPAYCVTVNPASLTQTKTIQNSRSRYLAAIRQNKFMLEIGKPTYRLRLISSIIKSKKFGFNETLWYLRVLKKLELILYHYLQSNNIKC